MKKEDGGDVEPIPNWSLGLVLNWRSRDRATEPKANIISLGLWRFWAWVELLQDPKDKEWLRDMDAGAVSVWNRGPWKAASGTSTCNLHGWTRHSHDCQWVLWNHSGLVSRCVTGKSNQESKNRTDTWWYLLLVSLNASEACYWLLLNMTWRHFERGITSSCFRREGTWGSSHITYKYIFQVIQRDSIIAFSYSFYKSQQALCHPSENNRLTQS